MFALDAVRDIISALASLPEAWARQAHSDIIAGCPLSLELTFRSIREARTKTLRDCLISRLSHCSAADAAQRLFRRRSCPHHR